MNLLPFLILGLGLYWALLCGAAKDNRVLRGTPLSRGIRRAVTAMQLGLAGAVVAMRQVVRNAREFEEALARVQRAVGASAGEPQRAIGDHLRTFLDEGSK